MSLNIGHIIKRNVSIKWQADFTTTSCFTWYESKNELRKILIGNCYPSKIVYIFNLNNNEFNCIKQFKFEYYPGQIYLITKDILAITGGENIYLFNLENYENFSSFKGENWISTFYTLKDGTFLIGESDGV